MREEAEEDNMQLEKPMLLEEIASAIGGQLVGPGKFSIRGISTDTRTLNEGELFIALHGERFNGHEYLAEAEARKSPAVVIERRFFSLVPATFGPARVIVPDTLRALGDLAHYYRGQFRVPLVAVTGSNGKTSTKEILISVLQHSWGEERILGSRGNWNNQVGVPLTLFQTRGIHRAVVLEFGTNRPGEIGRLAEIAVPEIGVITNVGPSHLEGFGGVEGVAREKEALLLALDSERGKAVLNMDDPRLRECGGRYADRGGEVVFFGFSPEASVRAHQIRPQGWGLEFQVDFPGKTLSARINFPGMSGVKNALAAGATARAMGLNPEEIVSAWERISPFPQRLNPLKSSRGFWVIDDSYNANPDSVAEALAVLGEGGIRLGSPKGELRTWAVLGEMLELGKTAPEAHYEIGRKVGELGIDRLALLDSPDGMARLISDGARRAGMGEDQISLFQDPVEIGGVLREQLGPDDVVLIKGSRATRMDKVVETILKDDVV